jgi:hypothetical protein
MAGEYDSTEFIDSDFLSQKSPLGASAAGSARAPLPDDVNRKVVEAQQKLAELKRAQEELERERAGLEELRRRQNEFQTGRDEIIRNLTRGLGLLEKAEFTARRDAEMMVKTLEDFRTALAKVQAIQDAAWTKENFQVELTRALTTIENARMEWNSARLKFAIITGDSPQSATSEPASPSDPFAQNVLRERSYAELCKMGLALTWPVALVGVIIVLVLLLRH